MKVDWRVAAMMGALLSVALLARIKSKLVPANYTAIRRRKPFRP